MLRKIVQGWGYAVMILLCVGMTLAMSYMIRETFGLPIWVGCLGIAFVTGGATVFIERIGER